MAEQTSSRLFPPHAIAIIGLAGRFPGARSLDDFWSNVRNGVESIEIFSDADLDAAGVPDSLRSNPYFVRKGTALDGADLFDAAFFGLSPREAQILDPQHRIFLECVWEALEYAGYGAGVPEKAVGVFAGAGMNTYLGQILQNPSLMKALGGYQLAISNNNDFLCTRASYKLDLHGPSMTIQTGCSTSLVAIEVACGALNRNECDVALAGGVSVTFPQRGGYLYEEGMISSPDGHCRPFDAEARGTRGGAGAGIVVLKRLTDALTNRDTIHAVIRGAAVNNDGAGKAGYTAPSVDGQIEVIAMAQALAKIDPRTISYVETHGTGTPLGDPIEIAALTQVFRASTHDLGFCRIGALKANIGHLDVAAGVASLIKTVLAIKHREIPPLVNFRRPNPQLNLDRSPFVASAQGCAWTSDGTPRRAGVSAFGIGGTNAHVVLEEAPEVTPSTSLREAHLLVLSAKTVTAMEQATSNLAAFLDAQEDVSLSDVEWTLQVGRQAFSHRRALVVRDPTQAVDILRQPQRKSVLTSVHEGGARPVAFLFSGQGSQHVGMGAGLYRTERIYREAIDRCAGILEPHLGMDIRQIIFADRGDAKINETRLTQPALFATEYALASLWRHWGITPKAMLGHSIGEYVAAHLAGVLSLEDALKVVAARGRLMQELPSGRMAAVHLSAAQLGRWLGEDIEIAAVNAQALCTVSGSAERITDLLRRLEAEGIESTALYTSHAFHSSMMEPALAPFTAVVKDIALSPPKIPYVSNVTGTWITAEQATSPAYYATHLRCAVQFEAGVRTLAADSALFFLEVGPRNALTSMARMIVGKDRAKHVIASLSHSREERPDAEAILDAVGRLWLDGASVDWGGVHAGALVKRIALPTYPFERKRYWVEAALAAAPQRASGGQRVAADIEEMLHAPTWTRDDSLAGRAVRMQGTWFVLGDQGPLADTIMALLTSAGAVPVFLEQGESFLRLEDSRFRVRAGVAEDIVALGREVDSRSPVAGAIVLWGVTDTASAKSLLTASSYDALVALAEGLEHLARGSPIHIVAASTGAQSVLDEPVFWPKAALAFGPVLVLPTEVPGLRMRSVDLELREGSLNVDAAARALVEEAASLDTEAFVARRAGRRWVRRFERVDLPSAEAAALPLKSHGVYLITGGLGGIGLKLASWLATVASARLLLTARTPLPPRTEWDTLLTQGGAGDRNAAAILAIREIELAGGEVITAAADAADLSAMGRAIEEARTCWGEIDGVIHSAGIPGNGRIAFRKEPQDFRAVVAPKVEGLDVLVQLLGDKPLDFVALMSSANALLGSPGACDYAAANAVLDAFAESNVRPAVWRKVIAFDWGAWREVGMAAKHAAAKAQRAEWEAFVESSFVPTAGVEAFARVLASGRSRVVVMPYDLIHHAVEERREQQSGIASARDLPDSAASRSSAQPGPELSSPFAAPGTDLERRLAAIWTELLGVERIGVHDNFFELGGDSLLATRVLVRISQSLSVRLTLRSFFDAPTISQLAKRIGAVAFEARGTSHLAADDREEIIF
jgi:phthiocerol/phenolphthiocerol synthesis type-I polyketide synthase E